MVVVGGTVVVETVVVVVDVRVVVATVAVDEVVVGGAVEVVDVAVGGGAAASRGVQATASATRTRTWMTRMAARYRLGEAAGRNAPRPTGHDVEWVRGGIPRKAWEQASWSRRGDLNP